jgi:putative oxidoreductase
MFLAHGLQKAFGLFGGSGIGGFSKMLSSLGFSPLTPFAYLVVYIELIGGLLLILGLFMRIASFLLIIVMLVAIFKVHFTNGFFMMSGGYEYNFIIICSCISLLISGPGHLSITKKL